jgi:tetratricopeptide (TPR) repeat protein
MQSAIQMLKPWTKAALEKFGLALVSTRYLELARNELDSTKSLLAAARSETETTRSELVAARSELAAERAELLPPYAGPLKPTQFATLLQRYDTEQSAPRAALARSVMARAVADPGFFAVALSKPGALSYGQHPLTLAATASCRFGEGKLREATAIFEQLVKIAPTQLNWLCLARTMLAQADDERAIAVLQQAATLFPKDQYICMELATTLYQRGDVQAANNAAGNVLSSFDEARKLIAPLQEEADRVVSQNLLERPPEIDIYTDDFVADTWWFYYRSYTTGHEYRDGNVELDTGITRETARLLSSSLEDVTTFVDFGAFCGFTIANLAKRFPKVKFIGVDRPLYAKKLNDAAFQAPNLEFVAGDILDVLRGRSDFGSRPVLFHSRTAVFCYPAFLALLYETARDKGFRDVVFQEGSTFFSRWHLKFFELGKYPAVSMAGRGSTLLHDYKALLERSGYSIRSSVGIRLRLLLDDESGFGADHRVIHASA